MTKKLMPALLLGMGLVGLFIAIQYIFPAPTLNELRDECNQKCAKYGAGGTLIKEITPYSPKESAQKYNCSCH